MRGQLPVSLNCVKKFHFNCFILVIKIMLIAPESNHISKCQEKINNHLNRCISSFKITDSDGIFHNWEQNSINAFYKFCKDKCVLPQINKTGNELELSGSVNCVRDAKIKWYLARELVREKTFNMSRKDRRDSTQIGMKSTAEAKKICNAVISYSDRDAKPCQRLINRLIDEEFNVWAEPARDEQLRDISSQMNKVDLIILCISENSYENRSCEKEARYAFETGKPVLLVKLQNDPLIGWQREVFEGKSFIQLFGSYNHFNLESDNLLLQIVSRMQLVCLSRLFYV